MALHLLDPLHLLLGLLAALAIVPPPLIAGRLLRLGLRRCPHFPLRRLRPRLGLLLAIRALRRERRGTGRFRGTVELPPFELRAGGLAPPLFDRRFGTRAETARGHVPLGLALLRLGARCFRRAVGLAPLELGRLEAGRWLRRFPTGRPFRLADPRPAVPFLPTGHWGLACRTRALALLQGRRPALIPGLRPRRGRGHQAKRPVLAMATSAGRLLGQGRSGAADLPAGQGETPGQFVPFRRRRRRHAGGDRKSTRL